jgi:diacylglycerol kinase (ATP)
MPRCCGLRLSRRRPPAAAIATETRRPRRILVIFNPAAGRGRRYARRLRRVVGELERRGCNVAVCTTDAPGDAQRMAREADPAFDLIVAAGGDGTVNEVVNGLFAASRPLAVLPLGTGNVLANEIGLPRNPRRIARVIADGTAKPIWPGRAGDRLFVAMTGVGFDAAVLAALDPGLKRRVGKLAFVWAILLCLLHYRPSEFVVSTADGAYRAASVIVTKGRLYAGRFVIAPAARLDDPLLHIVLFRQAGRFAVLRCLGAMMLGALHRLPDVSIITTQRVSVAAGQPVTAGPSLVETDGEIGGRLPLTIEIAEAPLLLVQPGRCGADDFRNRAAASPV